MSATVLKNLVDFAGVAIGATAVKPHGLLENGVAVRPNMIMLSPSGSFTAVADAVNVSVTNVSSDVGSVIAFCEHWHTTLSCCSMPSQIVV